MTEEEKAALVEAEIAIEEEVDTIAEKDKEIAKLVMERDNYKNVALKRLGKLPGDAEFIQTSEESGLTVEEQVKQTLIEREIARAETEKEAEVRKMTRENSELRFALKNRPGGATLGGDNGSSVEVKDNVFSAAQLEVMKQKAIRLNVDPQKFIDNAKKNIAARS